MRQWFAGSLLLVSAMIMGYYSNVMPSWAFLLFAFAWWHIYNGETARGR